MVLQREYTFEFGVQQIENALSVVPYGKRVINMSFLSSKRIV